MSTRNTAWLAWLLWWLTCAFTVLGLLFLALSWSAPVPDNFAFRGHPAIWALAYAGAGQFLARRRPQNAIGWLFLILGLTNGILVFGMEYPAYVVFVRPGALPGASLAGWVASWIWVLVIGMTQYILLLFPAGRLPSHRWRPFAWAIAGAIALLTFAYVLKPGPLHFNPYLDNRFAVAGSEQLIAYLAVAANIVMTLGFVVVGSSIVLRLRRARGVEQQQLKWFAYTSALLSVVSGIDGLYYGFNDPLSNSLKLFDVLIVVGVTAIPLTVGIAILRYRLYEIDRVINRTLVYALLTLVLGAIYFGSVVLLQQLFRALTGQQQSEIVTVVSTLVIAALFVPLRRRVQNTIDRRFYRRKYDAAQVLAAFAATARDEVDLNKLSDDLLNVVDETMQPAHVSLWLRQQSDRTISAHFQDKE